jgi:hypothetical protein
MLDPCNLCRVIRLRSAPARIGRRAPQSSNRISGSLADRRNDLAPEQPAANNGSAGGQLAVQDNNTTGRFLNQSFSLEAMRIAAHGAIGQKTPIMLLYTMAQPAWHREQGGKT